MRPRLRASFWRQAFMSTLFSTALLISLNLSADQHSFDRSPCSQLLLDSFAYVGGPYFCGKLGSALISRIC